VLGSLRALGGSHGARGESLRYTEGKSVSKRGKEQDRML